MDETQRRKLSAKEFIQKNANVGYAVGGVFVLLFVAYFAIVFFYSHQQTSEPESQNKNISEANDNSFFGNLLPVFEESPMKSGDMDKDFLSNFSNSNSDNDLTGDSVEGADNTKIIKVEDKPIAGYVVFDKPVSIKKFIKIKPQICSEKLEVVMNKEEKSTAVLTFQNTLQSIDEYSDTPQTGVLDIQTRDKIYTFQKRYADILYKKKADKTPSRVIDVQTVHFLNLLCGQDKENADDFINVPTLRYVLKETREIFDYNTDNKEKTQIEAKLATGTEDVTFSPDGGFSVFRKEKNGTIDSTFYNIRTKGVTHLENNITTLDFNEKSVLYYGVPSDKGINIKSYNYLDNSAKRIATLPLNEWDIRIVGKNELGISSRPSAFADGIYMILSLDTGKLRQVAGPLLGLSVQKTTMPDFSIISTGGNGVSKTLLLNNKTRNIGDFGITTFAEKCAQTIFADGVFCAVPKNLAPNFIYPDDWYKGKIYTEDIIMFKTLSGTSTRVISTLENRPLSVVNLNVNKNGIFFMDENTLSLYSLEL